MRTGAGARRVAAVLGIVAGIAATTVPPAPAAPISKPRWFRGVAVTEYFPVPERWFVGKRVRAPGLKGRHRVDWLYSARGLSMEGDGIGANGRRYHIAGLGAAGWVNERGRRTRPTRRVGRWSNGRPFWRAGGFWRNEREHVTFPLSAGGWHNGEGVDVVRPPKGISFARGPSRPLRFWRSVAVDPDLIPLGSRVYIPAYRDTRGRGWFRADDVGGAIIGRHVDVFRPPPADRGGGDFRPNERIYVIPRRSSR